jgi:hypothetical protein
MGSTKTLTKEDLAFLAKMEADDVPGKEPEQVVIGRALKRIQAELEAKAKKGSP